MDDRLRRPLAQGAAASPGARLRVALAERPLLPRDKVLRAPLQIVGAVNAYTALQAAQLGFKAIYLSGGGVSLASLGMPDLGTISSADVCEDVRRITRVCAVPLLVDIDTGFGNLLAVERCVRDVEAAGAAAVHLEDQEMLTKRCGHLAGKSVVPTAAMVDRLHAAAAGRRGAGFVLIARTDALAVEGMAATIARCRAYVAAGADALFPEALTSLSQYSELAVALPGVPILANMTEFGKTPLFSASQLAKAGVAMSLYPLSAFRAQSAAAHAALSAIKEDGDNVRAVGLMHSRATTYGVIDYDGYQRRLEGGAQPNDGASNGVATSTRAAAEWGDGDKGDHEPAPALKRARSTKTTKKAKDEDAAATTTVAGSSAVGSSPPPPPVAAVLLRRTKKKSSS